MLQVYDLVIDRRFEYFMLFWIVMSCGQMMAERPSFSLTSLPHRVRTSSFLLHTLQPPVLVQSLHSLAMPHTLCQYVVPACK